MSATFSKDRLQHHSGKYARADLVKRFRFGVAGRNSRHSCVGLPAVVVLEVVMVQRWALSKRLGHDRSETTTAKF